MNLFKYLIAGGFIYFSVLVSCKQDEIITDKGAELKFSTDTVFFDTILTTYRSVTKRFLIYNPHDQDIVIQSLNIGSGSSSFFKLNVDGTPGNSQKDIKIAKKDSMYVFVEAMIDPLGSNTPMVVNDSVVFMTNGNLQTVKLVAFGQDVNLYRSNWIKTQTWTPQKPYLIYNNAAIDSAEVLTIEAGTTIYLNNNSSLIVYGKLIINGTLDNPVIFAGDRFDAGYREAAGQWGTIYIDPKSKGNLINYAIIKNPVAGFQVGYPGITTEPSLELRNCMILNASAIGIYAIGANINAYNTIVTDCGQMLLLLEMGGSYNFYNCTFSNISAYAPSFYADPGYKSRSTPSLYAANYVDWEKLDVDFNIVNATYHKDLKELNFYNSILYGVLEQEIAFRDDKQSSFNYLFDHCMITNNKDSLNYNDLQHFISIKLNENPRFKNDSISKGPFNFQLDSLSPAIDSGSMQLIQDIPQLQQDYEGYDRTLDGKPDMGAYEHHE